MQYQLNLSRSQASRNVCICFLCVFATSRQSQRADLCGDMCRHCNRGLIIFPIRKTRANWAVRSFQCAITINHHHDPKHALCNNKAWKTNISLPRLAHKYWIMYCEKSDSHLFLPHFSSEVSMEWPGVAWATSAI